MWPPLASYRVMDKEFTCKGSITAFRMCNVQYFNNKVATMLGLSLWSKDTRLQDRRILYPEHRNHFTFFKQLVFKSGDQLEYIITDWSGTKSNDEIK